jgi:transposase
MEQTIRMWIKEQPDLTLEQIGERLAEQGIEITTSPLWYQLDKWGLSFKKNAVRQRARARGRATGAY